MKQNKAQLQARTRLHTAKAQGTLTPQAVADFAFLHFVSDQTGDPITPAAHHWLWLELICNPQIKNLWIIATPESAKTTWILAYLGASIAFWPERTHLIASITGGVAEKRSLALRTLIESDQFKATFPNVLRAQDTKWDHSEWSVAPNGKPHSGRLHPTVFAAGTGGSVIGARARVAVGDDIQDFDSTRTFHQRETVNSWLHNSFLSRVAARVGLVRMIGNSWHHDDSAARAKAMGNWVICHMPILSEGPEVYATITYPDNYEGVRLGEPVGAEVE